MGARSVRTVVGEALTGIRRNALMSVVSSTTVAISLFVLAVFLLAAVNVDNMTQTIEQGLEVRVYLNDTLDPTAIDDLRTQVLAIPGVTGATYVSKEEALDGLRGQLGADADLLEGVDEMNPLRDSLRVQTEGPAWVETVASAARTLNGVEDVGYTADLAQRLLRLTTAIRTGGIGLIALMVLATLFVISNTVRLTIMARSDEVGIMKLVGATNWFIRWPFLFEGLFLGVAGAALAALAAWRAYIWAVGGIYANLSFIPIVPVYPLSWRLALILVGAGAVIGAMGSSMSLRRFLKA